MDASANKNSFRLGVAIILLAVLGMFLKLSKEPGVPIETRASAPMAQVVLPKKIETRSVANVSAMPKSSDRPQSADSPSKIPTPDEIENRRAAGKMALVSLYAAERAYFYERRSYTTDLRAVGWAPSHTTVPFKLGFLASFDPNSPDESPDRRFEDARRRDTDALKEDAVEAYEYAERVAAIRLDDYTGYCKRGCTADEEGFEALVVVPLDDEGHVDVWLIDEEKNLELVKDGMFDVDVE